MADQVRKRNIWIASCGVIAMNARKARKHMKVRGRNISLVFS